MLRAALLAERGYNLDAGVGLKASDREGLERLCRCILRPPLAKARLSQKLDGTVVCGPPRLVGAEPRSLANPRVGIEVLSPSTAALDKGVKFAHYRRCATIEVIVFVSQPDRRVEVYSRGDGGWRLDEGRDAEVLRIPALDVDLPLDAVYRGVDAALAADEP